MTTCTWAGFTAVRICIVVFSFSKITAVLCFWHNTDTAMSFFHNLTSISANQHFCFVVTVSWQQNFISNCPLLFWRPCAQCLVHLYFFQTHVVLFLVLLVITHCWPEIKHQEYANIYTQTSLVSGCSPPQLYHWENPSFPKKMEKENPQTTKKGFGSSTVLIQESLHTSLLFQSYRPVEEAYRFKKQMGRLFKNILSINSNFLMLIGGHLHLPVSQSSLFPLVIWSPDCQHSNLVSSDKSRDTLNLSLSLSEAFSTI